MFLNYFALFMLFFVGIVLFYGIIVIHDIPYEIAKKRNHPHSDAIHVAGWISLFTLHAIWPFLWIWATLWREERGWGFSEIQQQQHDIDQKMSLVNNEILELRAEIRALKDQNSEPGVAEVDSGKPEKGGAK